MWTDIHDNIMDLYISDPNAPRLLVAYIDSINGLVVDSTIPAVLVDEITFFIKRDSMQEVTAENFLKTVQYGTVTGGHIRSLLRLMTGIYAPIFFGNTSWPDSIKNDFSAQLHKFLASLTDTRWKLEGKTVLYIPNEGLNMAAEVASKNKELVQRLESKWSKCNDSHC